MIWFCIGQVAGKGCNCFLGAALKELNVMKWLDLEDKLNRRSHLVIYSRASSWFCKPFLSYFFVK